MPDNKTTSSETLQFLGGVREITKEETLKRTGCNDNIIVSFAIGKRLTILIRQIDGHNALTLFDSMSKCEDSVSIIYASDAIKITSSIFAALNSQHNAGTAFDLGFESQAADFLENHNEGDHSVVSYHYYILNDGIGNITIDVGEPLFGSGESQVNIDISEATDVVIAITACLHHLKGF